MYRDTDTDKVLSTLFNTESVPQCRKSETASHNQINRLESMQNINESKRIFFP